MNNVVDILKDLIALPSINPKSGVDLPADWVGEQRMAAYIEEFIRSLGIDLITQETALPGRRNVGGMIRRGDACKTILLQSHMDTVDVGGNAKLFDPVEKYGRLYGRGACDAKGCLAAMMAALSLAAREPDSLSSNVIFMAVADEEITFQGSLALVSQEPTRGADFGLVGEPTECRVVNGHKGLARWSIETKGVSCHAAHPEKGANAIYRMAMILRCLEDYQQELARVVDPQLGTETISVGTIRGGTAVNVVPALCTISVDRRLTRQTTPDQAKDDVDRFLRQHGVDFECGMSDLYDAQAAFVIDPEHPGVKRLCEINASLGLSPAPVCVSYGSDAFRMNGAGIPTALWGPGSIAAAHGDGEFIETEALAKAVQFYLAVMRSEFSKERMEG